MIKKKKKCSFFVNKVIQDPKILKRIDYFVETEFCNAQSSKIFFFLECLFSRVLLLFAFSINVMY